MTAEPIRQPVMPPDLIKHAGKRDTEQRAGGIGRIIEAHVFCGFFGTRVGQNEVRVQRRIHGERQTEKRQSDHQNKIGTGDIG